MQKISSQKLFQFLFHFLFWGYSMLLPIIDKWGATEPKEQEIFRMLCILVFPRLILFFFNTEYLIPKILEKQGIGSYIIALILTILAFILVEGLVKQQVLSYRPGRNYFDFRTVYSVLFNASVSSVYGFVVMMVGQEKKRRELEAEQLQSELSFLRSQISPHFIFNVLNSIVYLIRSKSDNAESVTIKLSELMRYMLYQSDDKQVLLAKEIEYLHNYIDLQSVRFEEDVKINCRTEGQIGSETIEPMLLIPFVENAFKHGVGLIQEPVIDISIRYTGKELNFMVKNKVAPETSAGKDSSSGIGLRNVKRRLELLYPNRHELRIEHSHEWFETNLRLALS